MPDKGGKTAGVPRRFSIGRLMLLVTFFALFFGTLRWCGARWNDFVGFTLLTIGVGLAQPLLFSGKKPRAASVLAGTVLTPLIYVGMALVLAQTGELSSQEIKDAVACAPVVFLFGALYGYVSGCLIAAVFLNAKDDTENDAEDGGEEST